MFDLYDSEDTETVIQTVTLTAADIVGGDTSHWQGEFTDLPKCHDDGTEIHYIIRERTVTHYNTEYSGEHFVVNSSDSYSYTPRYNIQINWEMDAFTAGSVAIVYKDNKDGCWYRINTVINYDNAPTILRTQEAYLMYRSNAYKTGIAIKNVVTTTSDQNISSTSLVGYPEMDLASAIASASTSYSISPALTADDFVDGSNGYRDNTASTVYSGADPVYQFVKVGAGTANPTRVTRGVTGQEILDAEGFRITAGFDYCTNYGPVVILWRNSETGKLSARSGSLTPSASYDIPSKEFYIMYVEYSSTVLGSGVTLQSIRPITSSSNWITKTYADEYDSIEDFISTNYSSVTPVYIDGRYGVSAGTSNSKATVYTFVYSANYQSFTSETPVIDDYSITNSFDYHQWPVPISKVTAEGDLLSGAHLKLYNSSNELVSEWDSSSAGPQVVTLWPGTYTLRETTVPAGYLQANDITFTLSPIGEIIVGSTEVQSVSMVDETSLTLAIDKVDYDQPNGHLSGALLELYENDNLLLSWTSNGTPKDITTYVHYGHDYRIHESASPRGYNSMPEDIYLHVANDGTVTITTTEWAIVTGSLANGYVVKVYNHIGVVFPSTGASDRTWVYLGSVMILLASAALLIRRKRKRNNA